ncbi:hypothetical protein B0H15DRAFT_539881 [Mycena belliarum]|uniref:Secreted protein n=1 Tax=Mycena belliarum TaxID=1033014 RepID=A0AAD6TSG3_9AGAR|nr:hypothetical protein B0H15DRAFT_539881 [Mycena belliae]
MQAALVWLRYALVWLRYALVRGKGWEQIQISGKVNLTGSGASQNVERLGNRTPGTETLRRNGFHSGFLLLLTCSGRRSTSSG